MPKADKLIEEKKSGRKAVFWYVKTPGANARGAAGRDGRFHPPSKRGG